MYVSVRVNRNRNMAAIQTAEGEVIISRDDTITGRTVYTITRPDGSTSTAHDLDAAIIYIVKQALKGKEERRAA